MNRGLLICLLVIVNLNCFGQYGFKNVFFLDFNSSKYNLLEFINSNDLQILDFISKKDTLKVCDRFDIVEQLGVAPFKKIGEQNGFEKLFKQEHFIVGLKFYLMNDKFVKQRLRLDYENKKDAIMVREELINYFITHKFPFVEELTPKDKINTGAIGKAYLFYKNENDYKSNFSKCDLVRLDFIYHKKERINYITFETEFVDVASIIIEIDSYNMLSTNRSIGSKDYLLDYQSY